MRRSLAWNSAAVTALVAVAFLVPLLVVVGQMVRDRALAEAYRSAAATGSLVALDPSADGVTAQMETPPAGSPGPIAVHLPSPEAAQPQIGLTTGAALAAESDVLTVMRRGEPLTAPVPGGVAVLQPVLGASGLVAVVEVDVPDAVLNAGVARARAILITFALVMVVGSVALADRLASRVVQAAGRLQSASARLGEGDLGIRVRVGGPRELQQAAHAFNLMADRVGQLLAAERELVADLSHRLRTPLAGLLLAARSLGPGPEGDQVRVLTGRLQEEVDTIIAEARRNRTALPATADVVTVLRERLDFWGALAEDQGRPWSLCLPTDQGEVQVPVRTPDLQAVVDALIGNVFLHTPEGCAFRTQLMHRSGERTVRLLVEDAGPGISEPDHALLRGTSGGGSTGLGLDIVARVARDCGGRVRIGRSRMGGAAVSLTIPTAGTGRDGRPTQELSPICAGLADPGGGEPGSASSADRPRTWRARGRRPLGRAGGAGRRRRNETRPERRKAR